MITQKDILYISKETKKIQNLYANRNFEKVIQKTKILLKKDPKQAIFYNMIGLSYRQLNNNESAEKIFKLGLENNPKSTSILVNLGALYRNQEKYHEAKKNILLALEINEKNFSALVNYANILRDLNQNLEAIDYYRKALAIDNNNETLLINLAGSYQIIGEFEKSKKILRNLHGKFPQSVMADKMYSVINNYNEDSTHQEEMLEKLRKTNLADDDKVTLSFSIAKSFSDQKNPEMSSKYFTIANNLKFNSFKDYNFEEKTKFITNMDYNFNEYTFNNNISVEKPELIFIVGLPRSGTTLTHQIISSHSEVFGAGELQVLANFFSKKIIKQDFINNMLDQNNDKDIFRDKIQIELLNIFKQFDNNLIILDKAPLNFAWIGFIKILFPTAKIIHCKRNLRDTALSIYKNTFEGSALPWSYSQQYLIKFIDLYKNLMSFWHSKIPNYIYDCHYENLVSNPAQETKNLIKFCNLDWEDNCLDHTKNKTGIKTVSIEQARKPIYKSSVNLNETYLKYLDFLNKIPE